jgi:very-short-patch-repair endonuclease
VISPVIRPGEAVRRLAPALASHETAARLLGIELRHDGAERLTVARHRSRLRVPGWVVHRADVGPLDAEARDGVPCTGPVRTVADLARVLPLAEAVVAADSALRNGLVTPDELARMARATGRGAVRLRTVHGAIDPKTGSVLESLLRVLLREAGLPTPRTQYRVHDHGAEVARVDFCWPENRLVVEADGYAFHSSRDDYRRDRRRMNELERLGWRVLRFSWEDVTERPDHVSGLVRACLVPAAPVPAAA